MKRIDLNNYLQTDTEERRKELDMVTLTCNRINDADMEGLALLSKKLDKVGIRMRLSRDESIDGETDYISIIINYDTYEKTTKRNAGRRIDVKKEDRYKPCTVSELNIMLSSGMKKTEIIAELGCPKPTFYRILQNIADAPEDASIWLYTYPR